MKLSIHHILNPLSSFQSTFLPSFYQYILQSIKFLIIYFVLNSFPRQFFISQFVISNIHFNSNLYRVRGQYTIFLAKTQSQLIFSLHPFKASCNSINVTPKHNFNLVFNETITQNLLHWHVITWQLFLEWHLTLRLCIVVTFLSANRIEDLYVLSL